MKPERIQIFASLIKGARSLASLIWSGVKWFCAALRRFFFGCPEDR